MPRTPLFRLLRDCYRLTAASERSGVPAAELAELARERRVSRRAFLQAGAATAGVSLAGCALRRPFAAPEAEPDVIVVGAGLAGLTAAYRLRDAGARVRLIEAQDRLGGRCFSLRNHFGDGQVAELGGELIDSGHTHIRALAEELDLELDDLAQEEPGVDTHCFYFGGRRYSDAEVLAAFRPVAARIQADLATIGGDGRVTYATPLNAGALDRLTLDEWLTRAGVTGWFRRLLEVAYTTEYGLEPDEQSALNLLLLIGPDSEQFRIFGESDERFHVRGGNDRIVQSLVSRLDGSIQTGTLLEAVRRRADGLIELSVTARGRAATLAAPHVVLAVPFTLLRAVRLDVELPPAKRQAIAEIGYGTNAKLMIGFDRRVWRDHAPRSNGSVLTDIGFQCAWETSRAQAGRSGILTNFTGGRQGIEVGRLTEGEQAQRTVGQLEQIFPGTAYMKVPGRDVRFHWPSHIWTKGSYAAYRPGQWTTIHGAAGERAGSLHFAGEHCSLDAQGFLEGAVETGDAAARAIADDLRLEIRTPRAAAAPAGTGALSWRRRHEVLV